MPARKRAAPSRMIIVANRLPVRRQGTGDNQRWVRSSGGLVTALTPILQERGGAWLGWTGTGDDPTGPFDHDGIHMRPVPMSAAEIEAFYHEISNRTLWPLYHDAIRTPEFDRRWWGPYVTVNQRFAEAAAEVAKKGDFVWVHDYHLQLVPAMLRELRPDVRIGFFLHIPFPPEELFAWLPWREQIIRGLLGADVVGFQTYAGAQNFSRAARKYTPATGTDTQLEYDGRTIRTGSYPISIDFKDFEETAQKPEVVAAAESIRRNLGASRKILLCVDRLDYTKGIDQRLSAFELMLERKAATVEDCVMVQIAVPSREPVPEYAAMRRRIEQIVGRVNGDYSEPGRIAVHYFRRSFPRDQLVAYYLAADVMLVTPYRDGMNLVAKEYVATRADNSGVLVLSEFAGAAQEMRRALLVNPRDVDGMSAAMERAIHIDPADAKQRMSILRTTIRRHDVFDWADSFIRAVQP